MKRTATIRPSESELQTVEDALREVLDLNTYSRAPFLGQQEADLYRTLEKVSRAIDRIDFPRKPSKGEQP